MGELFFCASAFVSETYRTTACIQAQIQWEQCLVMWFCASQYCQDFNAVPEAVVRGNLIQRRNVTSHFKHFLMGECK